MIYADFNGSAPLCSAVVEYLQKRLEDGPYANPNAIHSLGKKIRFGMEKCRRICADALGADASQIFFNSGASEGISQIFHSVLFPLNNHKNVIITSEIEHSAVVSACQYYKELGYTVEKVKTFKNGQIDLSHFQELLKNHQGKVALACVMAANNETGVIQPHQDISKLCRENDVTYFSDTTQYIGKTDFNFQDSGMDFAVLSGHKIGALVGTGILLAKDPLKLKPIIFGGGQEAGLRGGTQNYIGNETLAVALKAFNEHKNDLSKVQEYRLKFEKKIKEDFPEVVIVGEDAPRLASTTLIAYPGIHGQAVQIELESNDIFVTTSSACSDNEPETSKVLKAMNVGDGIGRGVVRISLCMGVSPECYEEITKALSHAYKKLAQIKSF